MQITLYGDWERVHTDRPAYRSDVDWVFTVGEYYANVAWRADYIAWEVKYQGERVASSGYTAVFEGPDTDEEVESQLWRYSAAKRAAETEIRRHAHDSEVDRRKSQHHVYGAVRY